MAGVGKRAFGRLCACVSRGRCGARWPPKVSRRWIRVAGVGKRARSVRFAWQAWGMVRPVASLGIVLREKSAVRARVRALGIAKSWQAQGIRGFVDVSLERTFLGTQRQAASGVSRVRRCAVECSGRLWGLASGVSRVWRVWRCVMGIAGGRVAWVPRCHGDCWAARPLGGAVS